MAESAPLLPKTREAEKAPVTMLNDTANLLAVFQLVIVILFAVFTNYDDATPASVALSQYGLYKDIAVMIFIGFGFLMAFLKKYGYGAVGFTLLTSCMCVEWGLLNYGFWMSVVQGPRIDIPVNIWNLVQGLFAAAAVMISFGGLIGKISPFQLAVLSIIEVTVYAANAYLVFYEIKGVDQGGSIVIHTFGAYFGLAASYFLSPDRKKRDFKDGESCYHSDLFSFVATVFLWLYWPSFNAFSLPAAYQHRTLVNTILAMMSSAVCAFFVSWKVRGQHFDAVDIQNATLAGGVAIGTIANMDIAPFAALIVGGMAGTISVIGYKFLLNKIDELGIHDTCGINNLHGMPGLLGGLASVLFTGIASHDTMEGLGFAHMKSQWGYQLISLVVTFVIAVVSGGFTGWLCNRFFSAPGFPFTDEVYWNIPTSEVTFTKDDVNPEVKRRPSARNDRGIRNWGKMRNALSATRMLKGAAFGATASAPPANVIDVNRPLPEDG
eukprot:m.193011 g.193011  ORF g.193011 m.193011 type:complete len:494 (-) comp53675_c0_seq1:167-1648(-)